MFVVFLFFFVVFFCIPSFYCALFLPLSCYFYARAILNVLYMGPILQRLLATYFISFVLYLEWNFTCCCCCGLNCAADSGSKKKTMRASDDMFWHMRVGLSMFDLNSPEDNATLFGPYPINRFVQGLAGMMRCTQTHSHTHTHRYTYSLCTHKRTQAHTHTHTSTHTYAHNHTYTRTHKHTYTHSRRGYLGLENCIRSIPALSP